MWCTMSLQGYILSWSSTNQKDLFQQLQTVIPLGSGGVQVRMQRTCRVQTVVETTLSETIGSESSVLVIVDPSEMPRNWKSVDILSEAIGEAEYRVTAEDAQGTIVGDSGKTLSACDAAALQTSAQHLRKDAKVTLGDYNLDAKLFPDKHPYGSGSLRAEEGSGGMQQYAKNRLLLLESGFRKSPVWSFWFLERMIKNDLFFREKTRKKRCQGVSHTPTTDAGQSHGTEAVPDSGKKRKAAEAGMAEEPEMRKDNIAELFGRTDTRHIPESSAWWKQRQVELMSISDDHEYGLMTSMVTTTQNDNSPELLAHARRGPCAVPTDDEMCEYLLTRRAPGSVRAKVQDDAAAATLSYQRRTHALKTEFLVRHRETPLGVTIANWDRTGAQTREALHGHILNWNKRRKLSAQNYTPRPAIALRVPDAQEPKKDAGGVAPDMNAEDDVYYRTETARVLAELVRPILPEDETRSRGVLLWAFLLRCVQTLLYVHACTLLYCLKNRLSCRFFFPWDEQPEQQYDENKQRIALRRRHEPDDKFIVPHNLELAAFSPGTVNVMLFDYMRGADQCRSYACKYCGKPEPWYYMQTDTPGGEANPVKRYLQCRNVGLCMCHNRLMGFHVVRSTVPTLFVWPTFTVDPASRIVRSEEHLANSARYPDQYHYMNQVQKYFFRGEELRYLRTGQFFRYFSHSSEEATGSAPVLRTSENTMSAFDEDRVPDDPTHRHYDQRVSLLKAGDKFPCARLRIASETAVRRQNSNFRVPRSAFLEPLGGGREAFYEQRLLLGLPWHCPRKPSFEGAPPHTKSRWTFETAALHTPEMLRKFTMVDRVVEDSKTMEEMCVAFETEYASKDRCCPCCDIASSQCTTCSHALGWHTCEKDVAALGPDLSDELTAEPRWRAGTLHNGKLDVEGTMWTLARRLVPLAVLKEKLSRYVDEGQLDAERYDEYVEVGAHSSFWYLEKLFSISFILHHMSHSLYMR